jgi:hypothetical protein
MVEHVEISGEKILRYFDIRKWSQKEKEKRWRSLEQVRRQRCSQQERHHVKTKKLRLGLSAPLLTDLDSSILDNKHKGKAEHMCAAQSSAVLKCKVTSTNEPIFITWHFKKIFFADSVEQLNKQRTNRIPNV